MDTPSETHFKQLVYNASRAATSSITIRHAQVCDPLRLVVLRPGGKVGGTTIIRGHIEPWLCKLFYSKHKAKSEAHVHIFGGASVPAGCHTWMHHNGVWYRPSRSQRFRSHFANYTVIALLRDPRRRALSAYEWALPNAGKPGLVSNTVKRIFSFKRFLSDVPFIARFSRKSRNSYIWQQQMLGVFNSGIGRVDHIVCTHSMSKSFNSALDVVNARRENGTPALPYLKPSNHRNSNSASAPTLKDMDCGELDCIQRICEDSTYKFDCATIPCRDPAVT